MTATVKLARCRCRPSHLDPVHCPEYNGLLRAILPLARTWADPGEIPGADADEPADAADIATDLVQIVRDWLRGNTQ